MAFVDKNVLFVIAKIDTTIYFLETSHYCDKLFKSGL